MSSAGIAYERKEILYFAHWLLNRQSTKSPTPFHLWILMDGAGTQDKAIWHKWHIGIYTRMVILILSSFQISRAKKKKEKKGRKEEIKEGR